MSTDRAFRTLLRALKPHLGPHRLIASSSREWASATFEGVRHRLAISLEGDGAAARAAWLIETLGEIDLPIAGGLVADINAVQLVGDRPTLWIEALTIAEALNAGRPAPNAVRSC